MPGCCLATVSGGCRLSLAGADVALCVPAGMADLLDLLLPALASCPLLHGTRAARAQVRSAMVFCSTCRGCHLLGLILEELDIACAALHSQQTQGRRLAALDKCAPPPPPPGV